MYHRYDLVATSTELVDKEVVNEGKIRKHRKNTAFCPNFFN